MQNHMPVPPKERIVLLDVLRGIALFGILLINIHTFHTPFLYKQLITTDLWTQRADQLVYGVVNFFVQGKFYTMFSFLFGYGFYIFMSRAEQKVGLESKSLYRRRLFILLSFGLLHIIFFWWGDILTWYALAGLLLLAFYKQSSKALLGWAIGISAFYILINVLMFSALMQLPATESDSASGNALLVELMNSSSEMYSGSFIEVFQQRLYDTAFYLPSVALAAIFIILPMFLIGLYVARKGWLADVKSHIRTIWKIWIVTFFVGFGFTMLKQWGISNIEPNATSSSDMFQVIGLVIGDPALNFFYVSSMALLLYYVPKLSLWSWLADAGRMALTNYLLQTVVCTTLFYGYGFGLYGKIGAIDAYLIAVVIFALQLLLSRWWMGRFAYGPLEKAWRIGTYGRKG